MFRIAATKLFTDFEIGGTPESSISCVSCNRLKPGDSSSISTGRLPSSRRGVSLIPKQSLKTGPDYRRIRPPAVIDTRVAATRQPQVRGSQTLNSLLVLISQYPHITAHISILRNSWTAEALPMYIEASRRQWQAMFRYPRKAMQVQDASPPQSRHGSEASVRHR